MSTFLFHQLQASLNRSDRRAVIEDWEQNGRRRRDARQAWEDRWHDYNQPGPGTIYPDDEDNFVFPRRIDYSRW